MEHRKVIIKKKNRLLEITRFTIPYIKELKQLPLIKSTNACILMQQIEYWFAIKPKGFYKFLAPPNSIQYAYKKGDSWTEELTISEDEYRTAFDQIGVRYSSKKEYKKAKADDVFQGKYYCSYFDKVSRLTHYFRNHEKVEEAIDFIENIHQRDVNSNLTESTMQIPRNKEYQFIEDEFIYPESTDTTSNITIVSSERELSDDNKNSHLTNKKSEKEKNENNQSEDVKENDKSSFHVETDFNHNGEDNRPAEKILIPLDFEPTWDAKYRAIKRYENKSPADVTKKFIKYYRDAETKMTVQQMHSKWWDWIDKERSSVDNSKLETEQLVILNKVLNDIYNMTLKYDFYLYDFEQADFYMREMFGDKYSKETIMTGFQELLDLNVFASVGEYVFNYQEFQQSDKFNQKVKEIINACGLSEEQIFIASESPTRIILEELWRIADNYN